MEMLDLLKKKTRDLHDLSEQTVNAKRIIDGTLTPLAYTKLLSHMYRFHSSMETSFAPWIQQAGAFTAFLLAAYTEWLQQDLNCTKTNIPSLSSANVLPLHTTAQLMGALYVVEGSMLGGQFICKALAKNEQLKGFQPFQFYGGYGKKTGARWSSFRKAVRQHDWTAGQQEEALHSARQTFQLLIDIFDEE